MTLFRNQRTITRRLRLLALVRNSPRFGTGHALALCLPLLLSLTVLCVLCGLGSVTSRDQGSPGDFLLVRRDVMPSVQRVQLAAIAEQFIEQASVGRSSQRVPLGECIALVNPLASRMPRAAGMVILTDGERLPGEPANGGTSVAQTLGWDHPWLGRINVPLQQIDSVLLTPAATAPPPGNEDVIVLANGDRQEGLIVSLGSSISLEVGRDHKTQTVDIPLNLVAAITMVASKQQPTGKRLWFDDGTVIDVQTISLGDDGFLRLGGMRLASDTHPSSVMLSHLAAILLDPRGMIPLATLSPSRLEGPPTRYILPKPVVSDPDAPLGMSSIEFQGPLVVRYAVPPGVLRFSGEARLRRESQQWGDYEIVVRSNDREVFRTRLNAANPTSAIDVALTGRELTIEITEGANGPIQDHLLLERPILLMKSNA